MPQFKQGDTVRTKSGGPNMVVDGYNSDGVVICTYFNQNQRRQEHFIEATLELVPSDEVKPKVGVTWLGKERR